MELEELQALRTAELHTLRADDPVAWAIAMGKHGRITIADSIPMPVQEVDIELQRLLKAKIIEKRKWQGKPVYHPLHVDLIRLAKRAAVIKYKNRKIEEV